MYPTPIITPLAPAELTRRFAQDFDRPDEWPRYTRLGLRPRAWTNPAPDGEPAETVVGKATLALARAQGLPRFSALSTTQVTFATSASVESRTITISYELIEFL